MPMQHPIKNMVIKQMLTVLIIISIINDIKILHYIIQQKQSKE